MDKIKKLLNITNSEMENNGFLQGVIIGLYSQIEELKIENKQLKNKQGIWLSPEKINYLDFKLKEIRKICNS